MKEHGCFSVAKSASALPPKKSGGSFLTVLHPFTGDQLIGSGFRNFLGKPSPEETFRFNGQPIDRANQQALRTALAKLSYALEHLLLANPPGINSAIPSGYSYLMQLIAHDLVASASSLARIDNGRMALNNNRSAKLRLESIYDCGPEGSPLLYEPSLTGDSTTPRAPLTSLRLGPLNTQQKFGCPLRDLARVNLTKSVEDLTADVNKPSAPRTALPGLPDVIVGDPRNDDHAIISQLTVVFHLLHNGLVEMTKGMPTHSRYAEAAFNRYYYARMAATLIFRNVIRLDVLKRFLHPEIYRLYNVDDPPFVDGFEDAVPLELTHGALRVCHSMLRNHYQLNDRGEGFPLSEILLENSVNRAAKMPLPENWAAAWSFFFDIAGQKPPANMSVQLGPHYHSLLATDQLFPPIDDVQVSGTKKGGLAYRDMLSAALAGLWSVPSLIKRLSGDGSPRAKLFEAWPLADQAGREKALQDWMLEHQYSPYEMTVAERETLAKDPPLPFFLMFEALEDGKGARFGLLGSIIVAETIFGVLSKDPLTPGHGFVPLDKALEALGREVFDEPWLPAYPQLDSMGAVIAFVADVNKLQDTQPKFI